MDSSLDEIQDAMREIGESLPDVLKQYFELHHMLSDPMLDRETANSRFESIRYSCELFGMLGKA